MIRWRRLGPRLVGPMSRRPLAIAVIALVVSALGATGLLRFGVDSGQSLLVGSNSNAGQTYASFATTFGSDPIVVVFTARNPTSPYIERNLERLGALEIDLAHDPRVASVLGPGTVAGSLREAAVSEVSKVLAEYPYFIAETDYIEQIQKGNRNPTDLQKRSQTDLTNATQLLELYVVKAASDAQSARAQYSQTAGAKVLDSREKAVDAVVAKDPVPPLWAEYLAGPGQPTNPTAAQQFFAQVASSYGDCDTQIAAFLKIAPTCQVFFERTLLSLPNCPPVSAQLFCPPKPQWAAVLPAPSATGDSHEIITIRLKPQYVGDQSAVASLRDKINQMLAHGITTDGYTRALSSASVNTLKSLGALTPTECGGATSQQDPACASAFHDARLASVIAGAPLLGLGVVRSMTQLLAILFPVALFVMLLLLVGTFRVRGRVWPLLAAGAATVLTVGLALLTGTPITPAVLAGVPVLIGLGVDYAVQLVARFSEERERGADVQDALQRVVGNTARATLIAAITTVAGLAALAVVGGIDWGPLAAVPLVAEFALVLCAGVLLAWVGALFIALPLAVWSDQRRPVGSDLQAKGSGERAPSDSAPAAARTIAIADNWRGVVAPLAVLALFGWVLLRVVPVQTDVQQLLTQSLPELGNVETVQAETGFTNEIDLFVRGQVATGPIDAQTGSPTNVEWQCGIASLIRTQHSDSVGQATSIGDYVIASRSGSSTGVSAPCVPSSSSASPAPSPSPSPSPAPSSSASPGVSASPSSTPAVSPSALRRAVGDAVTVSQAIGPRSASSSAALLAATASPAATPTPSAPTGSAAPSALASPSATPAPSTGTSTQTRFLCDLRLFPPLSRTLVMTIGVNTVPCPPVDEYQQVFLSKDPTSITPTEARIAIGVHTASVADQAKLVDALRIDAANPPNGMTATPTGLAVLATTAYDNLVNRAYLLNLAPLVLVALVLFIVYRQPRRALLPLVPTAMAAGWAPLVLLLLGRLPGGVGSTLGSFNPLTVVLGALIVALGTEFGVVLLSRFYEERDRGLDPAAAAGAALHGVGRAIRVSALTLGAGFAVLALSGLLPNSLPLVADFGFVVVIDLALAVAAVFVVMLPVAVALEQRRPLTASMATAPAAVPATAEASRVAAVPSSGVTEVAPRPARPLPKRDAAVSAKKVAPSGPAVPEPGRGSAGGIPGTPAAAKPSRPARKAVPRGASKPASDPDVGRAPDHQRAAEADAMTAEPTVEAQTQPTAAPAAAAAAKETTGASLADRLRSLNELREAGLVTDAEFASMRAALLDKL